MEDLSLHILDLVENSTAADATLIAIRIVENTRKDRLVITIKDNGRGMDPKMLAGVRDPFVTTRTTRRVGLGLPLLEQATRDAEGAFEVHSEPGRGTEVTASFRRSHIDRKPLGDMAATVVALILGNPDIDLCYEHDVDGEETGIDTREIKEQLGDVPINHPDVLALIKQLLTGPPGDEHPGGPEGGE
jgi:hypothetical protein